MLLAESGEEGKMGDITYQAIHDVQLYYAEHVSPSTGIILTPVMDKDGYFRKNNGTGDYYPIDESTYLYIMEKLADKPAA